MSEDSPKFPEKSFIEVLTSTPPGTFYSVPDFSYISGNDWKINYPPLQIYCRAETCDGIRFFDLTSSNTSYVSPDDFQKIFIQYNCRNCEHTNKIFALIALSNSKNKNNPSLVIKLGELPVFGPHTPSRLITLIGPDKDYFLQGRRSESLGLGIGAFAYYRRVVENQKGRLIREIAKVAKRLGADVSVIQQFEKAATEIQFSKAVDDVKSVIPESLLIRGQNPLKLLHSALSEGIHAQSDAECLEIATSIRVVLSELAERITTALKEEAELTNAVNRLLTPKSNPEE